jgi:D-alanine-D-alanine ligase
VKKLRVLVLMHADLVPPADVSGLTQTELAELRTEHDVMSGLTALGHEVKALGLIDELAPLRQALSEFRPHVVWNLLEEFQGQHGFDQNVVSYLELMRVPYTGCNPRGLIISRDKALSKKILFYHRLRTPRFAVFPRGRKVRRPGKLAFPLFVKSLVEEASMGISQASLVKDDEKLIERVGFIHDKIGTDAIVEQFIAGRELYASVLGNYRLQVFPTWELKLDNPRPDAPLIATNRVKWNLDYQKLRGVKIVFAEDLAPSLREHVHITAKRIYRVLGLTGYARIDFRLSPENRLYFIEANSNPDIGEHEEFALAAAKAGIDYPRLLQRIVNLGIRDTIPGDD